MTRNRSTRVELRARIDTAAELLAGGMPRAECVSVLAGRYGVDRSTARHYASQAARALIAEVGTADLGALLAESVQRLHALSWRAECAGNLNAAVGAARAAASSVTALARLDALAIGHTLATVERLAPPTDAQRRKVRASAPVDAPF